ncbi:hypothetical protein QE152_g1744 [Popillia japonica]|uniref:Uncharacterized protein n=1 Tax=Popillia japonica TaxID=7064 RepID=A0AAW1N5B7_POPJA
MPNVEVFELYNRTKDLIRSINIYKFTVKHKWQTSLTYEVRGYNIWKIIEKAVQATLDEDPVACPEILEMASKLEKSALMNADSLDSYYDNIKRAIMRAEIAISMGPCDCDIHEGLRERARLRYLQEQQQYEAGSSRNNGGDNNQL